MPAWVRLTQSRSCMRIEAAVCCLCTFAPLVCFQCQGGEKEVFHYEGTDMNGGFVGLRGSISSSAQPPSPQETQSHHRRALQQCWFHVLVWRDRQSGVYCVHLFIAQGEKLTIFIHWAIYELNLKCESYQGLCSLHLIYVLFLFGVNKHWVQVSSYFKSPIFVCSGTCLESLCSFSICEFTALNWVWNRLPPLASRDLGRQTVCYPAHFTVWAHFLQPITIYSLVWSREMFYYNDVFTLQWLLLFSSKVTQTMWTKWKWDFWMSASRKQTYAIGTFEHATV